MAKSLLVILLLATNAVPIAHGFQQPPSSLTHHHHHHHHHHLIRLHSTVEDTSTSTSTSTDTIVTSPITGSETNIKYPTKRGSVVDSRLFIDYKTTSNTNKESSSNNSYDDEEEESSPLLALRLNHILFASHEMATSTLDKLTKSQWNFEEMASIVSNCELRGGWKYWLG